MKLTPRRLLLPLIAVVVLALTIQQTIAALHASGSWRSPTRTPRIRVEDPYTRVDNLFAQNHPEPNPDRLRNPFAFGAVRATPAVPGGKRPVASTPVAPPPPPRPTLTSIVWDNDPRATLRYEGRDFSVHVNSLFADFRVSGITSNEVTLERGGETIVLSLRPKGD